MPSNQTTLAFCFATGAIGFGPALPAGALIIAKGDEAALRTFINQIARHGDGGGIFVPGLAEAQDERIATATLAGWLHWISLKSPAGVTPIFRDWADAKAVLQ